MVFMRWMKDKTGWKNDRNGFHKGMKDKIVMKAVGNGLHEEDEDETFKKPIQHLLAVSQSFHIFFYLLIYQSSKANSYKKGETI